MPVLKHIDDNIIIQCCSEQYCHRIADNVVPLECSQLVAPVLIVFPCYHNRLCDDAEHTSKKEHPSKPYEVSFLFSVHISLFNSVSSWLSRLI